MFQQVRRVLGLALTVLAASFAATTISPRSLQAQTTTMTFDGSNSCNSACNPFDLLKTNYGSIAGVTVTNGILASFGSAAAFSDGMHWYDLSGNLFAGGFTIGSGAIGAFVFTATDPTATVRFDKVDITSNALNTATFNIYSLSNSFIGGGSGPVNANVLTSVLGPISVVGGFKLEFGISPGTLTTLELDNLQYTLVSSVTPEPATMSLLAFGLAGMAGAGIRRRKRSR